MIMISGGEHSDQHNSKHQTREIHSNQYRSKKVTYQGKLAGLLNDGHRSQHQLRTYDQCRTTELPGHQGTRAAKSIPIISIQSRQELAGAVIDIEVSNRWSQLGYQDEQEHRDHQDIKDPHQRTQGPEDFGAPMLRGWKTSDSRISRYKDFELQRV